MSPLSASPYPGNVRERDRWILERRPPRGAVDPRRPAGSFVESEPDASGAEVSILTVLLTNRECPWRCVFCDLWRHTLEERVAPGDLPAQLDFAVSREEVASRRPRWIKLYNAGSFFDPGAIPVSDEPAIAERVRGFERTIVESHPHLIGDRCWRWRDRLSAGCGPEGPPRLEIAMGLETVHEEVLEKLNKRVTPDDFARAAEALRREGIGLRAFVLVQPPFEKAEEAVAWAVRSAAFAFDCGAEVVSLIPVRSGNGALDALRAAGQFEPPNLTALEDAWRGAAALGRGRVFADLWDLERFGACSDCMAARRDRLAAMNRTQSAGTPWRCATCGDGWKPKGGGDRHGNPS